MSVAIFGDSVDSEEFAYLPVSGEKSFMEIWEPAILQLHITRLANGIYLKKEELPEILKDFRRIKEWALTNSELSEKDREYVTERIDWLLVELPKRWSECPNADVLWMG